MKQVSTFFLKVVILGIIIVVFTGMIWFPQTEGRATNLNLVSIYTDPLIIYIYLASIPFFVALFQSFKLLSFVERKTIFSQKAVNAVKIIKYCALMIPVLIILADIYIIFLAHGDDAAGPVALGIYTSFASIVIAAAASVFQELLQNGRDKISKKK